MERSPKKQSLSRLDWLSNFLDSSIPLGSSGYRIGMDPLIGLIPGIGDPLSALIGSYIIVEAARNGASRLTLARMMLNIGIDSLLGAIPIVGDLFDFAFKANLRNVAILREMRAVDGPPVESRLSTAFFLTLFVLLIFIVLIFSLVLLSTIKLFTWILD